MPKTTFFSYVIIFTLSLPFTFCADPGGPCHPVIPGSQCNDPNSICADAICNCLPGYFIRAARCHIKPIKPLDFCDQVTAPCSAIANTECRGQLCQCLPGLSHDSLGQRCIETPAFPGDICVPAVVDCSTTPATTCELTRPGSLEFACVCTGGLVTDFKRKRCLTPPSTPGDECTQNLTPCSPVPNTVCIGQPSVCSCNSEFTYVPPLGLCQRHPSQPGDICDEEYNPCIRVPSTRCQLDGVDWTCSCEPPWFLDKPGRRCIPTPRLPGDECIAGVVNCDAVENSDCVRGICSCKEGYAKTPEKCLLLPMKPGDECHPSEGNCRNAGNTTCVYHDVLHMFRCECLPAFTMDPDDSRCIAKPTRVGQPCHPTLSPCTAIPGAHCQLHSSEQEFLCSCVVGTAEDTKTGSCVPEPKLPGDSCYPDIGLSCMIVVEASTCERLPGTTNHYCKCDGELVTDIDMKVCRTPPLLPDDDCTPRLTPCQSVPNTFCGGTPQRCICNQGFNLNRDSMTCERSPLSPTDSCHPVWNDCHNVCNTECQECTGAYTCRCISPLATDEDSKSCLKLPAFPGDPCKDGLSPCDDISFSECKHGRCTCIDGFAALPDQCLRVPLRPAETCHPTVANCGRVLNTTCVYSELYHSHLCECLPGWVTDYIYNRCLQLPTRAGESCHRHLAPCFNVPFSDCVFDPKSDEFTCQCQLNYLLDPFVGKCLSVPEKPGDTCDPFLPLPCDHVENATTCTLLPDGTGYYCKCDGELVNDPTVGRCLAEPQFPLDLCHPVARNCSNVANTMCRIEPSSAEYKCQCLTGTILDTLGRRCIARPTLPGHPCEPVYAPCTGVYNTTCTWEHDGHYCKCRGDLITEGGVCFPTPRFPGDRCSLMLADCSLVDNTTCATDSWVQYTYCRCTQGYFTHFERRQCVPDPLQAGEMCDPRNPDSCIDVAGSRCQLSGTEHACKCREEFYEHSGGCHLFPTFPDEDCNVDDNCRHIPGSICVSRKCLCRPGEWDMSQDGRRCIQKHERLEGVCESSLQCTKLSNSDCTTLPGPPQELRCLCLPGFIPNSGADGCILLPQFIGDACSEDLHCRQGVTDRSVCQGNVCRCVEGLIPSENLRQCLQSSAPDGECIEDGQCKITMREPSHCEPGSKTCKCLSNTSLVSNKCYLRVPLMSNCTDNIECYVGTGGANSYCNQGFCNCRDSYLEQNGVCESVRQLGDPCETSGECQVNIEGRVSCVDGKCQCYLGSRPISDKKCSSVASLHLYASLIAILLVATREAVPSLFPLM